MSELDFDRIREDYPDHDQWCPIESQGICNCPKGVIDDLLRAVEQLAKSAPLLHNLYTSMFLSEERNEGLPPQVQYWLQEIPKFLDSLDSDVKKLVEDE